jgi:hypothetical protein
MKYYRRVGQEDEADRASSAAGKAALERAKQGSWPPTEGDFKAVGAVAGTAACAAIGAGAASPLCGIIGTAVGSFVYQIGNAIASGMNAGYNPAAQFLVRLDAEYYKPVQATVKDLTQNCGTSEDAEYQALQRLGAVELTLEGSHQLRERALNPSSAAGYLETAKKNFYAAASARAAECSAHDAVLKGAGKSNFGLIAVVGIAGFIGFGLLQKLVTRGKF